MSRSPWEGAYHVFNHGHYFNVKSLSSNLTPLFNQIVECFFPICRFLFLQSSNHFLPFGFDHLCFQTFSVRHMGRTVSHQHALYLLQLALVLLWRSVFSTSIWLIHHPQGPVSRFNVDLCQQDPNCFWNRLCSKVKIWPHFSGEMNV